MLDNNDTVAIAVSGGKDSLSLLYIMKKIFNGRHRAPKLLAFTIDEGINGYRSESLKIAQSYCSKLAIPTKILSYKEIFRISMDDAMVSRPAERMSSCSMCGTLRRRAMDLAAESIGADVLATAHNLDDYVQSFVINILAGDIERIGWSHPEPVQYASGKLKKIKPFVEIYEKEIVLYALQRQIPFQSEECPYMHESIRSELRQFLNMLEKHHPGIKYNIYNTVSKISKMVKSGIEVPPIHKCSVCKRECSSAICAVCKTLNSLVVQD
jgi:uncharacterized protein (TIGR00269 family)